MNFYTGVHPFYCGVDLHARSMYLCILDECGQTVLHRNLRTDPQAFLQAIAPYREGLVVAVECVFCWYWLADLCQREGIAFILGHALSRGGRPRRQDQKRPQRRPQACPERSRRDRLARARRHLPTGLRLPARVAAHARLAPAPQPSDAQAGRAAGAHSEYRHPIQPAGPRHLPALGKKIAHKRNREGVAEHFPDPEVRKSVELDLALIDYYDDLLRELELHLNHTAKIHDAQMFYLLRSIPGVGKILALVLMYEIHNVSRFPTVQDFTSYCRLVKPSRTSAGKHYGSSGKKIGSAHLKGAFSEAAQLFLRGNEPGQTYFHRLESKYGKGKALSILAHKLGRAVYYMLKRGAAFDVTTFLRHA